MSKCKVNITIGTGSYTVEVDSTQLPETMEQLLKILKKDKIWNDIKKDIRKSLIQRKTIDPVDLSELESLSKVIPNTTVGVLKSKYNHLLFPDGIDDIPILLVNKYKTLKDGNLWGRYINNDGKEIFIIDVAHIRNFADYLSLRKIIDEGALTQSQEIKDKVEKCLEISRETFKVNDEKELIFKFIHNKELFRNSNIMFDKENTLVSLLDYICDTVFDNFGFFRESHNNSLINNIAHSVNYKNGKIFLSKNQLRFLLNESNILNFESDKEFREFFNKSPEEIKKLLSLENVAKKYKISSLNTLDLLNTIFNDIDEKNDSWEILTKYVLALDKSFKVSYSENNRDNIILSNFVNFKSQGIYMPDFKGLEVPKYYNGLYITKIVRGTDTIEYYVTSNYPLDVSKVNYFPTEGLAKKYIDELDRTVSLTSRINIHYLDVDLNGQFIPEDSYRRKVKNIGSVTEGTVLTVLDYNLIKPKNISPEENNFLKGRGLVKDFNDYIYNLEKYDSKSKSKQHLFNSDERNTILSSLSSPEKIAIFVSEIARLKEKYTDKILLNEDAEFLLNEILPKLNESKLKYYFVHKINGNTATLIPFDSVTTLELYLQEDKNIPISRMWEAVSEGLFPILKTPINILTSDQIEKLFNDYSDKKAFIKGGQIYINISIASTKDLMHEYAHIILAYLKNNKQYRDTYKNLLQSIWDTGNKNRRNTIIDDYRYESMEDKMEEFFVSEFGEWIDREDIKLDKIFRNNLILELSKKIFDPDNKSKSIKDLFGKTIGEIFTTFNNNVSNLLSENPGLIDELFLKLFTLSRRQSNWILKRKNNNELEEVCE